MKFDWPVAALSIAAVTLPCTLAIKSKDVGHEYSGEVVYGQCAPLGPLSSTFIAKRRLPGFPFEFPNIVPGQRDKYLIFPAPDALAGYEASIRRCQAYRGSLVNVTLPVEMEILACAIGTPSFIGSWLHPHSDPRVCVVLYPGGVVSMSRDNCLGTFGAICKVPGPKFIGEFQAISPGAI